MNLESAASSSRLIADVCSGLEGSGRSLWIVGGTVRDLLADREVSEVDLVVDRDQAEIAHRLADALNGSAFQLSDQYGCWRVVVKNTDWQVDICPLRGVDIESDLAMRDFTVNAMAIPIDGGNLVDSLGGCADRREGTLRVVGASAFKDDPLRVLRLARFVAEQGFKPEPMTVELAGLSARGLTAVSGERAFFEFRKLLVSPGVLDGLSLMQEVGATDALLPELSALRGIEQTPYHQSDAYRHTLEVLEEVTKLEADPSRLGQAGGDVDQALRNSIGDGLSGWDALRLAAICHDLGKSKTRSVNEEGRVSFVGHDRVGAEICVDICRRLRTSRALRGLLAGVTRNHLRLGFLVNEQPLNELAFYHYIDSCEPFAAEVTVLTIADRLATRGARTKQSAIDAHVELAAEMLQRVVAWRGDPPRSPLSGDELVAELAIDEGPLLGQVLKRLRERQYTAGFESRDDAVEAARAIYSEVQSG